jgi:F-type H+-transporting ATPase subunit alpha
MPEALQDFKRGNLAEDTLKKMVDLANTIIPQYK